MKPRRHVVIVTAAAGLAVVGLGIATLLEDLPELCRLALVLERSRDEPTRCAAIEKLGARRSTLARAILGRAIRRSSGVVPSRRAAFEALARNGRSAESALLGFLSDPDWVARFWAACFLGEIGEHAGRSLPRLREASERDGEAKVRDAALIACERIESALAARRGASLAEPAWPPPREGFLPEAAFALDANPSGSGDHRIVEGSD
jgi:hypothetical protein